MTEATTVYVSIGNSDDKLTQSEWSEFVGRTDAAIRHRAARVHGWWMSPSQEPWQNACWCIEISDGLAAALKRVLAGYAVQFRQDSIAWAVAQTEFIAASRHAAGATATCRCGRLIEQESCGSWSTPDGDVWCSADQRHAPLASPVPAEGSV